MSNFKDRLAAAQQAQKAGKAMAEEFSGNQVPAGTYISKLQAFCYAPSQKGRPQVKHTQYILEGEQAGRTATVYMGLEHEVAIAIMTAMVVNLGYEMPEIFDWDASERNGDFVITKDFDDTLAAIEGDEPTSRIQVTHKNDFMNIRLLEVLETGEVAGTGADAEEGEEAEEAETEAPEEAEAEPEAEEVDEEFEKLLSLCAEQGIDEVSSDMSIDDITKVLREDYCFWTKDVSAAQLKEYDGAKPEDGIEADEVAVLENVGLGDIIIKPVKKAAKKKAASKKTAAKKSAAKRK